MIDRRALIEPVREYLSAPRCALLATVGVDGAPRQVVIHYELRDDHLQINAHRDRQWVANVRRDPRVALIVHDDANDQHYVAIRGTVTLLSESESAVVDAMRLAERYGEDPANFADQPRVSFRLDVDRVHERG